VDQNASALWVGQSRFSTSMPAWKIAHAKGWRTDKASVMLVH
jgi:glutamate synthase domain-containing protein 1